MRSKVFINRLKNERGQVLVLAALLMTILMGFAALTLDIGMTTVTKSRLQNIADAAALAGAMDIPKGVSAAEQSAIDIAKSNDDTLEDSKIKPTADLDTGVVYAKADNANRTVEVIVTKKNSYTFAKLFGYPDVEISARAVAKNPKQHWDGDALPFLNIAFDYSINDPIAWTKVGPGIRGTILDFYTRGSGSNTYFEIDYQDGITITEGYANGTKGLDDSKLSDGLKYVLTPLDMNIKKVYIFSLSSDTIQSGKFTVNNKTKTVELDKLNKLNNKDVIDPYQLVLLECIFLDCKWANQHDIELEFTGNVYDLGNTSTHDLPDYPEDYVTPGGSGGKTILIE